MRIKQGYAALHLGASNGTVDAITTLLSAGADPTLLGCEGKTALELAKENPNVNGSEAYWLLNDALYG